jgi:hypothetical protein
MPFDEKEIAPRYIVDAATGEKREVPRDAEYIALRRKMHEAHEARVAREQAEQAQRDSLLSDARQANGRSVGSLEASELRALVALLLSERGLLDANGQVTIPDIRQGE